MALEGLTQENIDQYEAALISEIPDVDAIGNFTLRTRLVATGWTEELYWEIRNRLIERGVLTTGKGKGGSVRRVPPPQAAIAPADVGAETPQDEPANLPVGASEKDLYAPMVEVIKSRWAQDYRLDSLIAEITAAQGSRHTRGKWTRPDITVASFKTYPYVPGRHFDLITFEIKPTNAIDITVIYEALGHRRASTRAYALLHIPESERPGLETMLEEISLEAKRFGIGLVVAADPSDYDTWEELVEAVRHEPDPERLNDFLAQQVSQGFREQIIKWFK
ncbi:MAG: hypothetical protein IV112_10490 [Methyloversatilis discipulorum]|uniref:hypothetical protein n=1 Tax=Methyloversatilis discipulorum TaxID=1119528 RepID=UPI0026F1403B|nr:hypothetical protein [Methyloversatilis discipulorum]MBT9517108.1 hypothetical protein [Methyloversatilis discipulorum]